MVAAMRKPSGSSKPSDLLRMLQADKAVLEARRLREAGQIDQAASLIASVVQAEPTHVGALKLMGLMAMQTGATEIGIGCYTRALALSPRSHDVLLELGNALVAGYRPVEAVSAFKQALTLRPNDGAAFRGLGQAQIDMGNRADALKSFRKTLAILPYDQYAAHMIAALSGEANKLSSRYVPDLFDTYANTFDEHLTGTLAYRLPEAIREAILAEASGRQFHALLDLGCGTGLVGVALKDFVTDMDGIDISPKMIRKAAERGIYRRLRTGDALNILAPDAELTGPYDLVTAADVFIYIGPLEATFASVARVLTPGGLFAFSVESAAGDEVVIRSTGRFSHPAPYIQRLASQHGFAVLVQQDVPIRQERNQPIPGTLYLLGRA
jgi:predicted TPR repeat methyltransferase